MKFFRSASDYHPQGAVLFVYTESPTAHSYPGKIEPLGATGTIIIGLMFLCFVSLPIALIAFTWSNIESALVQTAFVRYFLITGIFVFGIIGLLYKFNKPIAHDHSFYCNVAKIYSGGSKQPYRWVLPDDVEYMEIKRISYKQEFFYKVAIRFKPLVPRLLGRYSNLNFCIDGHSDTQKLEEWAKQRSILFHSS